MRGPIATKNWEAAFEPHVALGEQNSWSLIMRYYTVIPHNFTTHTVIFNNNFAYHSLIPYIDAYFLLLLLSVHQHNFLLERKTQIKKYNRQIPLESIIIQLYLKTLQVPNSIKLWSLSSSGC